MRRIRASVSRPALLGLWGFLACGIVVAGLAGLGSVASAQPQSQPSTSPTPAAPEAGAPIVLIPQQKAPTLDGRVGDAEYANAARLSIELTNGKQADVRLLLAGGSLHVAVKVPEILIQENAVRLFITTDPRKGQVRAFTFTPYHPQRPRYVAALSKGDRWQGVAHAGWIGACEQALRLRWEGELRFNPAALGITADTPRLLIYVAIVTSGGTPVGTPPFQGMRNGASYSTVTAKGGWGKLAPALAVTEAQCQKAAARDRLVQRQIQLASTALRDRSLDMTHQTDAAVEALKEIVRREPSFILMWHQIALIYKSRKRLTEALAACDATLKADEFFLPAIAERGALLGALGRKIEALAWYMKFSKEYPEEPTLLAEAARLLLELKKFDDAREFFDAAIARVPENSTLPLAIADAWRTAGRDADAAPYLDAAAARAAKDPSQALFVIQAFAAWGAVRRATTLAERAAKHYADDPGWLIRVGRVLRAQNVFGPSLTYVTKAAKLAPANLEYQLDALSAYVFAEKFAEAVARYAPLKKAVEAEQARLLKAIRTPGRPVQDGVKLRLKQIQGMLRQLLSYADLPNYVTYDALRAEYRKQDATKNLPRAKLTTSRGTIVVELFEDDAANAVANFIQLVEAGIYNNGAAAFYRVIGAFMAQGGTQNRGSKGNIDTVVSKRKHFRGTLSMANAGAGTESTEFFLCTAAAPWLNGRHTVFGRVIEGQDVLDRLAQGDTIVKIEIIRKRNHAYTPKYRAGR